MSKVCMSTDRNDICISFHPLKIEQVLLFCSNWTVKELWNNKSLNWFVTKPLVVASIAFDRSFKNIMNDNGQEQISNLFLIQLNSFKQIIESLIIPAFWRIHLVKFLIICDFPVNPKILQNFCSVAQKKRVGVLLEGMRLVANSHTFLLR